MRCGEPGPASPMPRAGRLRSSRDTKVRNVAWLRKPRLCSLWRRFDARRGSGGGNNRLGLCYGDMAEGADAHHPTAEQYRESAKFLRRQAEGVSTATDRLHLLRIADEFDRLADSRSRPQQTVASSARAVSCGSSRLRSQQCECPSIGDSPCSISGRFCHSPLCHRVWIR